MKIKQTVSGVMVIPDTDREETALAALVSIAEGFFLASHSHPSPPAHDMGDEDKLRDAS